MQSIADCLRNALEKCPESLRLRQCRAKAPGASLRSHLRNEHARAVLRGVLRYDAGRIESLARVPGPAARKAAPSGQ
jgi:hypothetical protein